MNLKHKSFSLEIKLDAKTRVISGYASVFGNVDSTGDIVLAGAFLDTLKRRTPKMLYQHDSDDLIGVWDVAREDSKGLYVEGRLAETSLGNEAYELAKMGALDAMSIGYTTIDSEWNAQGYRLLKKVELYEVSLVTFPANELATINGVKNAPKTIREFEDFLREEGHYSREDATTIALRGFKAFSKDAREAQAGKSSQLMQSMDNLINILRS